ncbi:MAG: sulfurtransferase TusA family protein [Burkholderiales bacterium]|jgi:TusA-related sulfurtransferase
MTSSAATNSGNDANGRPAVDLEVDASGLNCPLPILKAKKALAALASGQTLKLVSTDPGSVRDFEAFARQTGNTLIAQHEQGAGWAFYLRRR